MKLLWQLSKKGLKLRSDPLVLPFISSNSDKFVLIYSSHVLILSLGKIIFEEVFLESFISFLSLDSGAFESPTQGGSKWLFTAFGGYVFIGSIVNARIVDRQSHSQLFFANQRRHEAKTNEKSSLAGRDQPLYATDQKKGAGSFVFETFIGS